MTSFIDILALFPMLLTLLPQVLSYATAPPNTLACSDIRSFTLTIINTISSGSPYSDSDDFTVNVPYPAGITFTSTPRVTCGIIRF